MRTFLDAGAVVTVIMVIYAVSALFIPLPDVTPYTQNAFPGSLLVFPLLFVLLHSLRSAWRSRRPYWFVGLLLVGVWGLSAIYYVRYGRKEFANDAQQDASGDGSRPVGEPHP